MRQESWVQGLILSFFICGMGRGVDLHGKILLGVPASDAAACGHTVAPWVELFQRLTPALSLPQTVSPCLLWVPCSQVLLCAK